MTMTIRDKDIFEATSPFTALQRVGLDWRSTSGFGRNIIWIVLAGMTLIAFARGPFVAIPPDALFPSLKGLSF